MATHNHAGFFLKHFDDKGDHVLGNEDFNITGIIDREFASVERKALAFSSRCMLWPVGSFYTGSIHLSPEEMELAGMFERRGRHGMTSLDRNGGKCRGTYSSVREEYPSVKRNSKPCSKACELHGPGKKQTWSLSNLEGRGAEEVCRRQAADASLAEKYYSIAKLLSLIADIQFPNSVARRYLNP